MSISSKVIFEMRRMKQIDKALPLARELYKSQPNDAWNVRALGWVLYDHAKRAVESGSGDQALAFVDELGGLPIPADDHMLLESLARVRKQCDPSMEGLYQAQQASKAGQRKVAMDAYRKLLAKHPGLQEAQTGLGWEIEKELKLQAESDQPSSAYVTGLLQEYARLKAIERPSLLHSLVVGLATRLWKQAKNYIGFMKSFGSQSFRPEDFEPYRPEDGGHAYDSLVERVIKALWHAAKCGPHAPEDYRWARDFVAAHYQRFPAQEWFPYYYGRLLMRCGERVEARAFALPLVMRKPSEFWTWHMLAGTFAGEDEARRRACLCRALQCKVQKQELTVNVHVDLADCLRNLGAIEEADTEDAVARKIYQNQGWTLPPELRGIKDRPAAARNTALYAKHAPEAEDILLEGLPWHDAVVTGQLVLPKENKPERIFIGYLADGEIRDISVKAGRHVNLDHARKGWPIRIKVKTFENQLPLVVAMEERPGEDWDILPVKQGVIAQVDQERGWLKVVFGRKDFCLFYFDEHAHASGWPPGSMVRIKVLWDAKADRWRAGMMDLDPNPLMETDYVQDFDGSLQIRPNKPFGFVGDVFVPPSIISSLHLTNGRRLKGRAICQWNSQKAKYGWTAVRLCISEP